MSESVFNLLFDLQIGDKFGAGVAAYQTAHEILKRPGIRLIPSQKPTVPLHDQDGTDLLKPFLPWSQALRAMAAKNPNGIFEFKGSVLLKGSYPFIFDRPGFQFRGTVKTIANYVFERVNYPEGLRERAAIFDTIICASQWCQALLANHGIYHTAVNHQTTDVHHFRPLPVEKHARMTIFSGGKFEFRKGQDLVIAAFREFAKKYDDVQLCLLWNNRWFSQMGTDFAQMKLPSLPSRNRYTDWLVSLGISKHQILEIGEVANLALPAILNKCHLAIFPSRAEGGTNICAMEAMACGLPVVLSANSGHLDLITDNNCLSLGTQFPVENYPQWGESSIEEMIAVFEYGYHHSEALQTIGQEARAFIREWTWKRHVDHLLEICGH